MHGRVVATATLPSAQKNEFISRIGLPQPSGALALSIRARMRLIQRYLFDPEETVGTAQLKAASMRIRKGNSGEQRASEI